MATRVDGRAMITDVRRASAAEAAGLREGEEIVSIGELSVAAATAEFEPRFLRRSDPAAREWALRVALAGRHDRETIRLRVRSAAGERDVGYRPSFAEATTLLTATVADGVGRIRVHNSLGDSALIDEFDAALGRMPEAQALVLDLRDTPSGGNSVVAKGILGRLVDELAPYQRHELVAEQRLTGIRRVWMEYVAPRSPLLRGPVVVLVGRWTGSMGEGLAIGLHAARGAAVLGRPMAHLLGALGESTLPHSGIAVRVPVEKLAHVDGTPREAFVPCAIAGGRAPAAGEDLELESAVEWARRWLRGPGGESAGPCPPR